MASSPNHRDIVMPDENGPSPETIGRILETVIEAAVPETDLAPLAELIAALQKDMSAMRKLDVGNAEPATTFEAEDR